MKYDMTRPCDECPFLKTFRCYYTADRLNDFASGEFPCHKTAETVDGSAGGHYGAVDRSQHCAGALIYLEKRNRPHQMMRICERLGMYDRRELDMTAEVR